MSAHVRLLASVGAARRRASESGGAPSPSPSSPSSSVAAQPLFATPSDRALLVSFLVHAADCSNPVLPPAVSQRRAAALRSEFERQARLEARDTIDEALY